MRRTCIHASAHLRDLDTNLLSGRIPGVGSSRECHPLPATSTLYGSPKVIPKPRNETEPILALWLVAGRLSFHEVLSMSDHYPDPRLENWTRPETAIYLRTTVNRLASGATKQLPHLPRAYKVGKKVIYKSAEVIASVKPANSQ